MKLNTPYIGEIEYNLDEVIIFEKGLYGFEGKQEFILINLEDPEFPFNWLQSIDDENLSFVLTSPFLFVTDYEFDLSDTLTDELGITKHEDVLILNTVVLNEKLEKSTMNLQAPIVINRNSNKGKQIILEDNFNLKYKFLQKKESN
ncbi:MAG: flagellar assembly protein FliW [Bacillota bacterium]|nr:flagellar assembly protein FliW [Bacillota bacterium]